ncbi:MAG: ribosomal protein S18-alanine N-acetyltransferase [Gammaproteobacteria bacterium]|nr:ribosomal protein S18-alanine N-acetyltransferase [Gammaproteobacteria bacterium]
MSAVLDGNLSPERFRFMQDTDLDEILAIENAIYPFPWTRGIFHDCLRIGYICQVLEKDEKIIGYSIMSVAVEEAHLLTIVVAADEQGKGYGKKLLDEMIRLAIKFEAKTMYLEVRTSNKTAIDLYYKRGFNELGIRNNYYPAEQGREDALIMALHLT